MGKTLPSCESWTRGARHLVLVMLAAVFTGLSVSPAFAHGEDKHASTTVGALAPKEAEHGDVGHDHALARPEDQAPVSAHAYPPKGVPRPLAWLGKFHPLLTHFPVALLTAAALAELLFLRGRQELFRHAVRFCVWGGAIGALLAAPLGWFFAGFRIVDDEWVMTAHRWAGTVTAFWALGLLLALERRERGEAPEARTVFRAGLLGGAGLVGATGFLGGALIYGLDHYTW